MKFCLILLALFLCPKSFADSRAIIGLNDTWRDNLFIETVLQIGTDSPVADPMEACAQSAKLYARDAADADITIISSSCVLNPNRLGTGYVLTLKRLP